ncbi:hypothetical protein PHLGIDRAFT_387002 [Phlebiopsis gigantea 11061_1 CR5-6]|uniref:Uncharacterized protein n=1 Tax=Phlebiopsis gigantea (strain 11061_1 CR5-6) TaxID=745531 RepID=A0A0C3SBR6_PHLG1|nr:hypothetical protein PHLGIDRAFT_387002 [Phlebiopsis gigantea 11061_1 CR5-6]
MYSSQGTYGASPPPELSNNPFIDHPANALARYPDINGTDEPVGSSQFTSWMNGGNSSINTTPTGYMGAPSGFGRGYPNPQQTGYPGSPGQPTGLPFQPTSSFGQQLASQITGAYGQTAPQQQQQQYTGYPTSPQYAYGYSQPQPQQQPQRQNAYLPEFDPFAQQSAQGSAQSGPLQGRSQHQLPHPRDFVRDNKQGLESWDSYAWKQIMNCFDGLKDAWAGRKRDIEARMNGLSNQGLFAGGYGGGYGYGNQYGQAQEYSRLEQLVKQADSNIDTSGDLASKKRVRESINAALTNLPDWPPQNY